jgi:hypothetical protein
MFRTPIPALTRYAGSTVPAILLAALVLGQSAPPDRTAPANPALVRVFVHTEDGGHPEELAARRESVKHLADALADRRKTVAIVADDDLADVDIEILGRGLTVPRVVFGIGARPGQPPGGDAPMRAVVLRVKLTWAGDPFEFRNRNTVAETQQGWERAAGDLAKQIEKWIGERRAAILEGRRTR